MLLATSTVAPGMLLESQEPSLLLTPMLLSMFASRMFLLAVREPKHIAASHVKLMLL